MKDLVIFDLDGTLAKSKSPIDQEMSTLFSKLLEVSKVAIISGGDWPQFQKQVLKQLQDTAQLKKLTILPTCGTKFYQYKGGWDELYEENFTSDEKHKILDNLEKAVAEAGFDFEQTWGEQIEDRGSQITFSALGQEAPLDKKKEWDPHFTKRKRIVERLSQPLKEFSIGMGGTTSIDITKPGIDKAYGIHKIEEILEIKIADMMFIGDALFEGGNDFPARRTGVECIQVRDPEETKRIIETIVVNAGGTIKSENS